MNQAGLTMVEASSVEDILGISVFPFITPEDRTKWTEHHNRVCRGESLRWQYEIVGLKGTRRYLETHAVPLPNADGTFSQLAVTRDITQRKVTERELLEAFMRASSDVIYRMSADWNRMYTLDGRSFLADTGIPIDNWVDKYIPDSEQPRVRAAIAEAIRTKQPFELEHEVVRADKGVGYTFFRAIPVLNRAGEIVEWLGTATDVTENKRAEAALRAAREESEKRKRLYEAVTSSTPDLIYVFDLTYRFIYANEALLRMWGRTWPESAGKALLEVGYEPWHAEMHEREIDEVVATKRSIRGEVSFPHAVLGRRVYDYIFVPVLDEDGNVEAVAGTTRDITDLKQAEAVLERRVAERTQELNQANTALQQSNEDLLQFAHVASHDLKEPVRKIKTFGHRLEEELNGASGQARVYLDKMLASASRMSDMIDGVLAYSSINSESQPIAEEVSLSTVLQDIAGDLEVVMQQKRATLTVHDLPAIEGNQFLLYQLFYNLVNNAFKFAKADVPPVVTVYGVAQGETVRITVQDNGIGFEQSHAEKIFEAFARLNSKDRYEGTGLGLSLCRKIVARHHGTIQALGEPGVGATFIIQLPYRQS
jgi:PAS domain S-box-containing protein